jgi:hypothetical protein
LWVRLPPTESYDVQGRFPDIDQQKVLEVLLFAGPQGFPCANNSMPNKFMTTPEENPLIGKRVRLVYTKDPYTDLKSGDLGTVTDVNECDFVGDFFTQIGVKWDSGSNLMLVQGMKERDVFEVLN